MKFLVFLILGFGTFFCNKTEQKPIEVTLARVGDKYLYLKDIVDILPQGVGSEDSVIFLKSYIDKWIARQLMLYNAELNLAPEDKNVNKQLEDYRSSLLIYKYQNNMVSQKLDTVVTPAEIDSFYNQNIFNFVLTKEIVKALYIRIPKDMPNVLRLKELYKSDDPEEIKELESYCYQYAKKYDYFNDNWVYFEQITRMLPIEILNYEEFLNNNKTIEVSDENYLYFVMIREFQLKGTISPIIFVRNNIREVIVNKRKMKFINELENMVFEDGKRNNKFTIY